MPTEVILPRVDMDMTTGKIARWYVEEGQRIEKGKPLFEIETDKAAMEIEAPVSGIVRDIAAATGQDMPVGQAVAWIFAADEPYGPQGAPSPAATAASAEPVAARSLPTSGVEPPASAPADPDPLPRATPLARRLARESGIDLAAAAGSGPRGRIQSGDILALVDARRTAPLPAPADPAAARAAAAPLGPDGRLRHVWLRQGAGRPVLMIHGFGSALDTWRPLLSGLDLDRPVLGIDLPGHGGSPLGAVAGFEALVDAVEETVSGLELAAIDLIGHSLGGAVAAALAGRHHIDARTLMLIAPAGLGPAIDGAFLDGFLRARSAASLTPWLRRLVSDERDLPPALLKSTLRAREGSDLAAEQTRLAAALFPDGTQAFSIRLALEQIIIPTKIVIGLDDAILPARQSSGLPGTIALHMFPGVGHMPQIERRDAVVRLWGEMLRSGR